MTDEILLTKQGYEKIVAEYDELVSVKRKEVAERIKEAISYGDISENSEYDSAKNEQAELEERIHKLENMMRKAKNHR
jgi:Transcription elongation factor